METYIKQQIEGGYIDNVGKPLKCGHCNSTDFEQTDIHRESVGTVEYTLQCKNCNKTVGVWSYGSWQW